MLDIPTLSKPTAELIHAAQFLSIRPSHQCPPSAPVEAGSHSISMSTSTLRDRSPQDKSSRAKTLVLGDLGGFLGAIQLHLLCDVPVKVYPIDVEPR